MEEQNENLKAYFSKILTLQQEQRNRALSENELHDIALSLGVSEADWQFIQKVFENHRTRAQGYLQHNNWQDAIPEFEQALTLKPIDLTCLYGIAHAYKLKWQQSANKTDAKQAENYAKQCLEIKPDHQEALKLISDLRQNKTQQSHTSRTNAKKPANAVFAFIGLLIMAVTGAIMFLVQRPSNDYEDYNEPPLSSEEQASSSETNNPVVEESNSEEALAGKTPTIFTVNEYAKNFELEVESALLKPYVSTRSYSFEFKANLKLIDIEVDMLKFKVELVNQAGEVVAVDNKEVIQDYMPVFRNGDVVPVDFSIFRQNTQIPNVKEIRLILNGINAEANDAVFDKSPSIPFSWSFKKPSNFDLEIRERKSIFEPMSYQPNQTRHQLVLEIENTGNSSIKGLKLEVEWLDAQGNIIHTEDELVTYSSQPSIKRNQTRVDWLFENIEKPIGVIKNYRVNVISIE